MSSVIEDVATVFVLDGGFSTQLSCHVGNNIDGTPLWTASFLQTHPEQVISTHLDFLRAGSDIILTNTYQASIEGFVKHLAVTPEEGRNLILRAVELAQKACDTYMEESTDDQVMVQDKKPLIAGSIGPYGAHLKNASEYSGSYADYTSAETMREWHRPRIQALLEGGVDLLAFETIPCLKEAEMLVELLKEYPTVKAWMTFSCRDETSLAHGEDFQIAATKCWDANPSQLIAIGVNCCPPVTVAKLLKGINDHRDDPIPFIVYPNSGEKYNPQLGWIDRDKCEAIESFVHEWLDLGVRYVGGCCRTYATDISHIRTQVQSWYNKNRFTDMLTAISS